VVGQDPKFRAFCRELDSNQEPVKAWIFTQPEAIARLFFSTIYYTGLSRVSSRRSRHALQYTLLNTSVESNMMSALQKIALDMSESCVVILRVLISARICLFSFFKSGTILFLLHQQVSVESTCVTANKVSSPP